MKGGTFSPVRERATRRVWSQRVVDLVRRLSKIAPPITARVFNTTPGPAPAHPLSFDSEPEPVPIPKALLPHPLQQSPNSAEIWWEQKRKKKDTCFTKREEVNEMGMLSGIQFPSEFLEMRNFKSDEICYLWMWVFEHLGW